MKPRHIITLAELAMIAFAMSSCAVAPDGTKSVDPLAYQAALVALAEYQRQHPVHNDK